ncbi:MAG: DNA polymerase, partial [Deltaproteobacteria bacterium]
AMRNFFNSGKGDMHRWVAAQIHGKAEDEVTDLERTYAKSTSFGILYGAQAPKIAQTIGCSLKEAEDFMREYWKLFPNLSAWIGNQKRFVKINKYCESLFGRRRNLPDVDSGDQYLVEAALRQGINAPIQGDASDLTLYAIGRIWNYLRTFDHSDPNKPSRLRGSVHDSILASVHVNDVSEVISHVKLNILEKPELNFILERGVRLQADVSIGPNWGSQTDIQF